MKRIFVLLALVAGFSANLGAQPLSEGVPVTRSSAATSGTPCEPGHVGSDASGHYLACGPDGKWGELAVARADTQRFCYYEGKPYSEGATVAGKTCGYPRSSMGVLVFSPNEAQAPKNLVWQ